MADPRFYSVSKSLCLAEIAELSQSSLQASGDGKAVFDDVASLDQAGSSHVSFLDNRLYVKTFSKSSAGACFVKKDYADLAPKGMALLISDDPYRAHACLARAFYPLSPVEPGCDPSAHIDPTAVIGEGCRIEAGAVIGRKVKIATGCVIGANSLIGAGCVLGKETRIASNVSIICSLIGERVLTHAGARIGQDGFGFAMGEDHLKVPQLGRVVIGDDVEIGANATIDRGSGPDTVIGAGSKIDNLVQIAHNVQLGQGCVIVAQAGISGSTRLDDFVVVGGQAGLAGHLHFGIGAQVAGNSGVMRDVGPGETVGGSPAVPIRDWHRQTVALSHLAGKKDIIKKSNPTKKN